MFKCTLCFCSALKTFDFYLNRLTLELLYSLKKEFDFAQRVLVKVPDVFYMFQTAILYRNANDFIVRLSTIIHFHNADGPRWYQHSRVERERGDNESIYSVTVVPQCLGYKTVVGRIVSGAIINTIKPDEACVFVEFVLVR